jgi:hypothetical protein
MQKAITAVGNEPNSRESVHAAQRSLVSESLLRETSRDVFAKRAMRGGVTHMAVATAVHTAVLAVLSTPDGTSIMAAEAGAHAASHTLTALDVSSPPIGTNRQGWRGRLVYIEYLLRDGNHVTALTELRDMIDERPAA